MKYDYAHRIASVAEGSIAEELELKPGDEILEINGEKIEDVLDYRFFIQNEKITLIVRKKDGKEVEWELEKDPYEDLGIEFENGLMSEYRSCTNQCIFCFIDQMPPGMRETLYFKDDDARLSFLQGNYVTLTNMKQKDIDRIIRYHLSPINISVQATDPEVRKKMLHNRFAGELMEKLQLLKDAGIEMNGQIVLCPGINDGPVLEKSLRDLAALYPQMESVSVVPVGLTKFREGLYPLKPVGKKEAIEALERIEKMQEEMMDRFGVHFAHASDEFYLLAGRDLPEEDRYDGYLQLENGVGMLRLLLSEAGEELSEHPADERKGNVSIAAGMLAAPFLSRIAEKIMKKFPGISVRVYAVRNDYFGEQITVTGLLTGQDLKRQLTGQDLGERLLLSSSMFRSGEEVFLDDMTRKDLENALQVPVNIVKSDGRELVRAILGEDCPLSGLLHSPYEPDRILQDGQTKQEEKQYE